MYLASNEFLIHLGWKAPVEVVKQPKNNQVLALMLESRRRSTLHVPCFYTPPVSNQNWPFRERNYREMAKHTCFDVTLWDSWTDLAVPWIDAVTQAARDRLVLPGVVCPAGCLVVTGAASSIHTQLPAPQR